MAQQRETLDILLQKVNQKLLIEGQKSEGDKELKRSIAILKKKVSESTKVFSTMSLFNGGENV